MAALRPLEPPLAKGARHPQRRTICGADTVGAVTGQIAGALYDVGIPERWLDRLRNRDHIIETGSRLFWLGVDQTNMEGNFVSEPARLLGLAANLDLSRFKSAGGEPRAAEVAAK